jgi:hypothetical protein
MSLMPLLHGLAEQLTLIERIIAIQKTSCFMLDVLLLFHVFVHFLCWPVVRRKSKEAREKTDFKFQTTNVKSFNRKKGNSH